MLSGKRDKRTRKPTSANAKTITAILTMAVMVVSLLSPPLQAGEVLLSRSGLASWLRQRFSPFEQRLNNLDGRTTALESRLAAWGNTNLHRFYMWPDRTSVSFYSPGGVPAGTVELDVPPMIVDGRTMAPLRFVGESLGAEVLWNEDARQVIYTSGSRQIILTVGQRTVFVDGRSVEIDAAPVIVDGRTLVPVRFVGQWLGAIVKWDDELRRVEISYLK